MSDFIASLGARAGTGRYRRAIRLRADSAPVTRDRHVTAEMEDDVHHLGLAMTCRDGQIVTARGFAVRTPYAVCFDAPAQIAALEGQAVERVRRLPALEKVQQCLHLMDLAVLAARHVGQAGLERLYRIEVDHDVAPPRARLWRDGDEMLAWDIVGGRIGGSAFDGIAFTDLNAHLAALDADQAEAALLLRRASLISFVRRVDLDTISDSRAINPDSPPNCYAKQFDRRDRAVRNKGTTRDFWSEGRWPLETVAAP